MPATQPLAVTLGDPAGVGPELIAQLWQRREELKLAPFVLIGALPGWVRGTPVVAIDQIEDGVARFADALPCLPTHAPLTEQVLPGVATMVGAYQALASLERGVALALSGRASALVTLPVAKSNLQAAGFAFPGQSEFLAQRCGVDEADIAMLLWSRILATVPLTIHVPLAQAPRLLTAALIERRAHIVANALRQDFGIAQPRLALAGLNPHAGEQGAIGHEEIDVMAPAAARLRAQGLDITAPQSADGLFHAAARAHYDVALCPTHDQALIPVKALAFDEAVNITLGLPIVRTSPDHGTAFALAGKGLACAASLIAALELAQAIARRRAGARVD